MFSTFNDGWDNKVFIVKDDAIVLFIDCKKFSDIGKNATRCYGSTHHLKLDSCNSSVSDSE